MEPSLGGAYRVALLGEALGKDEAEEGKAFVGKAGFRLTRLIEWAGLDRSKFDIFNTVWCRPPDNRLEGTDFEAGAIVWCRTAHWDRLLSRSRVIIPMGNVATQALIGRKRILSHRGYVFPGSGYYVIPTVHPSYIQRGQAKWSAAFINDIMKGVELAGAGMPALVTSYVLDPTPGEAYRWAQGYLTEWMNDPSLRLAFDIETPWKGEEEDELDTTEDVPDWHIDRIGFSYRPYTAMSIPWAPEYLATIRLLMESAGEKVVWNEGFDVPRIRRQGVEVNGLVHDGMIAWHILHTDLPKKLEFVATFTCPYQPYWKDKGKSHPAYYNATDADVEGRSLTHIEGELKRTGLWKVYERDVVALAPILAYMHKVGMPIDEGIRLEKAIALDALWKEKLSTLEGLIPPDARKIEHVYVSPPSITEGLCLRAAKKPIAVCPSCGLRKPRGDHFKVFKRKPNSPCAGLKKVVEERWVDEYYRLAPFKPSREQLIRYHLHLKRPLPTRWDKKTQTRKVSFGQQQIELLRGKYPDPVYSLILEYRELDKVAGTYIGRPGE